MKLKTGTWVVVVDGGHATIFENDGTAIAPRLKMLRDHDEPHARTNDLGEDKPPRAFSLAGGRHASFEGTDLHQVEEGRFIARIAYGLSLAASKKEFAHIVIVASPVALGNFRKAASHDLKDRVILWLDKDLTKHSVADITAGVMRALEDTAAG